VGVQAWLLFGADAAASVAYCTALFVVIPYAVALHIKRMYIAYKWPMHAGKLPNKGTKRARSRRG
jgi:hypothetical protein